MDALITAAARALAAGDALGALKRVALRDDPPALALRGIAMAQLGDHARARELLHRAARAFGAHEEHARARCQVAEAEVALALRDLGGATQPLTAAIAVLDARADHANAAQARLITARRLVLLGRLAEARATLDAIDSGSLPAAHMAQAELTRAELAQRALQTHTGQAALRRAQVAARRSGVPSLLAEVEEALAAFERPAARCLKDGAMHTVSLGDVEALFRSNTLVLDACRHGLRAGETWLPLARRPVLFGLAQALAKAWPGDVDREALIADVFRTRHPDDTHRARLRVEIGRLRALVKPLARLEATAAGFTLLPWDGRHVAVLLPPIDGAQGALLALLADGAAWSTSALALALGDSQRTVQRALVDLQAAGRVRSVGCARAQRWLAPPLTGFTTILLLPAALPSG